jgi:hypothetical protein
MFSKTCWHGGGKGKAVEWKRGEGESKGAGDSGDMIDATENNK